MDKTSKWIVGIVIVLLIIWGGYYYYNKPAGQETVKIGATLALSGGYAYLGEAQFNGLRMAIDEINSNGGIRGKKLELISEDNQGDPKQAVSNVSKLLNVDNVDVILSAFTSITNAVKDTVNQSGRVMIYTATVRDIAESNLLFFRDYYDAQDSGTFLAKLIGDAGYKKIGFLTEVSDQCVELENSFKEESQKYGIEIIKKESFSGSEKDLKTNILKVKQANSEAILVCAWHQENILMKQLNDLGMIKTPTFHWVAPFLPVADTVDMRSLFAENKAVSTWYWFSEDNFNNQEKTFFDKYQKDYGINPTGESAYAYDDIYVLSNALTNCDKIGQIKNSQCLAKELLKTDYTGVAGKLTFSDKGVSNREITAITVKYGQWSEIPVQ